MDFDQLVAQANELKKQIGETVELYQFQGREHCGYVLKLICGIEGGPGLSFKFRQNPEACYMSGRIKSNCDNANLLLFSWAVGLDIAKVIIGHATGNPVRVEIGEGQAREGCDDEWDGCPGADLAAGV